MEHDQQEDDGSLTRSICATGDRREVDWRSMGGAMSRARYRHRWSVIDRRAMGRAQEVAHRINMDGRRSTGRQEDDGRAMEDGT